MPSQIACNTNKTRTCLAHWHTLPILHLHHIFHISTIHHRIISVLLTNSRVTIQHIKHANIFLEQLNNSQIFNKYSFASHALHWSHRPQQFSSNLTALLTAYIKFCQTIYIWSHGPRIQSTSLPTCETN